MTLTETAQKARETILVEQVSEVGQYGAEYRISILGTVRCHFTGSRVQAEAEANRIVRGIEADARWFEGR